MTEQSNTYDLSTIQGYIPAALDELELDNEDMPPLSGVVVGRGAHSAGYPHAELILAKAEELYLAALTAPAKEVRKPTKRRRNKN